VATSRALEANSIYIFMLRRELGNLSHYIMVAAWSPYFYSSDRCETRKDVCWQNNCE